jgi:hypothetical protein
LASSFLCQNLTVKPIKWKRADNLLARGIDKVHSITKAILIVSFSKINLNIILNKITDEINQSHKLNDLKNDWTELNNIIDEFLDITNRLMSKHKKWAKEVGVKKNDG